jgi:PilZ domain
MGTPLAEVWAPPRSTPVQPRERDRNSASAPAALGGLPEPGTAVSVSSRSRGRTQQARVVTSEGRRVFVEVETDRSRLRRGARVQLEWVDPLGLVQRRGRVVSVSPAGMSTVEIEFDKPPRLIQRREQIRFPVTLKVTAWSFLSWTHLCEGRTVDLSESSALLHLPKLPAAVSRIDLRLCLPDHSVPVGARVVRREGGDLVAVAFEPLSPVCQERLHDFLSGLLSLTP